MILRIVGIERAGIPNEERVHLVADQALELQHFIVLGTFSPVPGKIAPGPAGSYWFPPTKVRAQEHVFLFTGSGKNVSPQSGIHVFYWGMPQTMWNGPSQGAVILSIQEWQSVLRG